MLGYERGGGGRAQNTWTIDMNQTTDNVLSQIKDNCYELHCYKTHKRYCYIRPLARGHLMIGSV